MQHRPRGRQIGRAERVVSAQYLRPQSRMARTIGPRSRPLAVSTYSARGGLIEEKRRSRMPFCSSVLSRSDNVVGAMPTSESCKSWKRLAPCRRRSRRMRQTQLDPMTLSVRATGHSVVSCIFMAPPYPATAPLTSHYVIYSDYPYDSDNQWSCTMTPQIPGYLLAFESTIRPLVLVIALSLIWIGAAKMDAPARSRYTNAGALSVALIAWLAVAQYLGSANAYFATTETAVPTVVFGLLIPLIASAIGLWRSAGIARLVSAIPLHWIVAAQIYRVGGGIFLCTLGGWALALAIRAARGDWGRDNRLYGRCCGCAVGAKVDRRSQSGLPLVPFWHRRPCRGDRDGRIDLSRPAAPPCPRRA